MRSRNLALVVVMGACACSDDLTTLVYEIQPPDPPEPVYVLAVAEADTPTPSVSWGAEGEPIGLPAEGSIGYSGEELGGELVQICAVGRGEDERLLAAVSEPRALDAGRTVRVSMRLAPIEDESEVEPQCQGALVGLSDGGPAGLALH